MKIFCGHGCGWTGVEDDIGLEDLLRGTEPLYKCCPRCEKPYSPVPTHLWKEHVAHVAHSKDSTIIILA